MNGPRPAMAEEWPRATRGWLQVRPCFRGGFKPALIRVYTTKCTYSDESELAPDAPIDRQLPAAKGRDDGRARRPEDRIEFGLQLHLMQKSRAAVHQETRLALVGQVLQIGF